MTENKLNKLRAKIGAKIKERRKELNMTQEDLADKSGVHINTIRNIEGGNNWPVMVQFLKICDALGLDFMGIFEKT